MDLAQTTNGVTHPGSRVHSRYYIPEVVQRGITFPHAGLSQEPIIDRGDQLMKLWFKIADICLLVDGDDHLDSVADRLEACGNLT